MADEGAVNYVKQMLRTHGFNFDRLFGLFSREARYRDALRAMINDAGGREALKRRLQQESAQATPPQASQRPPMGPPPPSRPAAQAPQAIRPSGPRGMGLPPAAPLD
jgi:hypothetical protein